MNQVKNPKISVSFEIVLTFLYFAIQMSKEIHRDSSTAHQIKLRWHFQWTTISTVTI